MLKLRQVAHARVHPGWPGLLPRPLPGSVRAAAEPAADGTFQKEEIMTKAKPAVFLVSIKIEAGTAKDGREFAKAVADAVETVYICHPLKPEAGPMHTGIRYELNLTKWEPVK
jgi:hypothetical protein